MPSPEALTDMMKATQEMSKELSSSIPATLNDPDLTLGGATAMLNVTVRYLAAIDSIYDAIESAADNGSLSDDAEEEAADFADAAHEIGMSLQQAAFERIRSLGGNANRLLASAQAEHYS